MARFIAGAGRSQSTLLPECLDDWVGEDNPVRAIDVFVDGLDLGDLGFEGVTPSATGRPAYHPAILLKLYSYGYLNRVQSSRRLERRPGAISSSTCVLSRCLRDGLGGRPRPKFRVKRLARVGIDYAGSI